MTTQDWNAPDYDRTNAGIIALGREVLGRLELTGSETVLDAGCGSGALTQLIAERLPGGHVIGVDASPRMIEFARERLAGAANVELIHADLAALDLGGRKVDAVFSAATFHWIHDHDRLWRNLRAVMNDDAKLVAQCGGKGNIASVIAAIELVAAQPQWSAALGDFTPHFFAGPAETERRLAAAGFDSAHAWLEETPVYPVDIGKHLREVIMSAHAKRLPPGEFERFAAAVDAQLGERDFVDYVRLNIDATA